MLSLLKLTDSPSLRPMTHSTELHQETSNKETSNKDEDEISLSFGEPTPH